MILMIYIIKNLPNKPRCDMEKVIELLKEYGFTESGTTRLNSFRTTSYVYPGGSVITLGGRLRFTRGNWIVTVGKRTTCISLKPDNPEAIPGRGRLIGRFCLHLVEKSFKYRK